MARRCRRHPRSWVPVRASGCAASPRGATWRADSRTRPETKEADVRYCDEKGEVYSVDHLFSHNVDGHNYILLILIFVYSYLCSTTSYRTPMWVFLPQALTPETEHICPITWPDQLNISCRTLFLPETCGNIFSFPHPLQSPLRTG